VTPAIRALEQRKVRHLVRRYLLPAVAQERSYGEAVAAAIGVAPERVFKTLVAELAGGELVVAIVPVAASLDLRALANAAQAKSAAMAAPAVAERATGYVTGGISPFGQRRRLRTFVDESASAHETLLVSGGRRGLQIELAPADLVAATSATVVLLSR
jgi:Cys-tRNA(Pro)/Cys-tRNA(Cys) deacylase